VSLEVYVERAVRGALGDTDTIVDHISDGKDRDGSKGEKPQKGSRAVE